MGVHEQKLRNKTIEAIECIIVSLKTTEWSRRNWTVFLTDAVEDISAGIIARSSRLSVCS